MQTFVNYNHSILTFSLHGQSSHIHRKTLATSHCSSRECGHKVELAQLSPLINSVKAISSTRYTLNSTHCLSCVHVFCCLQWTRKPSLRTEALIKQSFPLQITGVAVSLLLRPQENAKVVYCFHSTDLQTAAWSGNDVALCFLWDCSCSWWLSSETVVQPTGKNIQNVYIMPC